jgi:hypothetical protein
MRTRTVILAAALLLLAFGIFVWRQNISLRRELVSAQGKLAEQEALQKQSEADLQDRENHKRAQLESEKAALSSRINQLQTRLLAAQRLDQRATTRDTKPPQSSPEESAEQLATAVLQGDSRLLLLVPYFLGTFTVPDPLRTWIRSHPQIGYTLLFETSAHALQDLAANPKRLGAQLGMLGVLHTWSRTLIFHPHIHYLIPGGGLSLDQRQWVPSRSKFLLPEKPLALHFRTLFREQLEKQAPEAIAQLPAKIWKQKWAVDCQAVGSGENALAYLARYVFKTATGNRLLQTTDSGKVLWPYRDSNTAQHKSIPLTPTELIRRFLQHGLPKGFCRVRLFGWLHPAGKVRANRVRALLQQAPILTAQERQTWGLSEPLQTNSNKTSPRPSLSCPWCRFAPAADAPWSTSLPGMRANHRPVPPSRVPHELTPHRPICFP